MERPGFNYIEARFGRPDFEVWKILVAVVMIKVVRDYPKYSVYSADVNGNSGTFIHPVNGYFTQRL